MFFLILLGNIGLAVLPALVLLVAFHKKGPALPYSRLFKPLIFGYLIVIPAIGVEYLLWQILPPLPDIFRLLFISFIIAGFVEEVFKYLVIRGLKNSYENPKQILSISILSGAGFALFENLNKYVLGKSETLLLRSITAVPLHCMCAAFIGYSFAAAPPGKKTNAIPGLLAAIVFHGLYDLLLYIKSPVSYLVLAVLLIMYISVKVLFNVSRQTNPYFGPKP